jgi:hypothetical protein
MGMFDADMQKNNARKGAKGAKKYLKKAVKDNKRTKQQSNKILTKAGEVGRKDLARGEDRGVRALQMAGLQGRQDLTQGRNAALGEYDKALDLYGPIQAQADKGAAKYGDFFGLGGVEGFGRAQSDWEASPIFQAMTDHNKLGLQGLDRQANARGNPYNFTDQSNFLQDSASKYLSSDYIGGLRPYLDQQTQLTGQQADIYGNRANLQYGTGQNLSNLGFNVGQGISGNYMDTAGRQANLGQGIAQTKATGVNVPIAGLNTAARTNMGQAESDMFANITAAQNANTANKWGAINAGLGALGTIGGGWAGA